MTKETSNISSLRRLRILALLLTFTTGFTGLVYEVTWHRYLANFLGSQARASAIILAVFLGGLCVGYDLFGRYSQKRSSDKLVKTVGWIEIVIGLWAVFFPRIYEVVWNTAGILDPTSSTALLWDVLICILLIGLPTVLMGGTLPLLTQGLSLDSDDAPQFHARVYAINTGGAFLGCLAGGFYLLPNFGLPLTVLFMGASNLIAGFALLLIGARVGGSTESATAEKSPEAESHKYGQSLSYLRASVVAFLAGFYAL
ncbi:hypothetical protein BVY02_00570, partial [bacterium J17]